MREVILDTVSLHSLLRAIKMKEGRLRTALDRYIQRKVLRLVVDKAGGLVDEWKQTCGSETVEAALAQWEPFGGLKSIKDMPSLPHATRRKLNQLGFTDTIDKLIVRLSTVAASREIVSDDHDFWDPDPSRTGDPSGAVALLLRDNLEVRVLLLGQFVGELKAA